MGEGVSNPLERMASSVSSERPSDLKSSNSVIKYFVNRDKDTPNNRDRKIRAMLLTETASVNGLQQVPF